MPRRRPDAPPTVPRRPARAALWPNRAARSAGSVTGGQRRDERDGRGKAEHDAIDANPVGPRHVRWKECNQNRHAGVRNRHADRAPEQAEERALGQKLSYNRRPRPAPSAARSANSRRRAAARTCCRLVRFTVPMSHTAMTAPRAAGAASGAPHPAGPPRHVRRLTSVPWPSGIRQGKQLADDCGPSARTSLVAASRVTPRRSLPIR